MLLCSYFHGFGRNNPSKERAARLKKEQHQAGKESKAESSGAEETEAKQPPEQSAEDRDKEEKDKWRSWKAKLGLIG